MKHLIVLSLVFCCSLQADNDAFPIIFHFEPEPNGSCAGIRSSSLDLYSLQSHTPGTRSNSARMDFLEKSRLFAQRVQQREMIEQACMHSSVSEVAEFFEQGRAHGLFSVTQLLSWYGLYQAPSYRVYVKTLPGYQDHVMNLHRTMDSDKKVRKKAASAMGLTLESAQKLADFLYKDLQQDRAARDAFEQMQNLARERLRVEHERLNLIKTAQKQVMHIQSPQLEQCIHEWGTYVHDHSDDRATRYARRIQVALSHVWHEQSYPVSPQVHTLFSKHDLKSDVYTKLYGNELQQVLHSEYLSILNYAANLDQAPAAIKYVKKLNSYVIQCADIGCAYNKEGAVTHASAIADMAWAILDVAGAAAQGVCDGLVNTADLVMHPAPILGGIVHIGQAVKSVFIAIGDADLYKDSGFCYMPQTLQQNIDVCRQIGEQLICAASNLRLRDYVNGTACFVTECVLQAKLLRLLGSVSKRTGNYVLSCAQAMEASLPEAKAAIAGIEGITTGVSELGETIARATVQEEKLFNLIKQADGAYRSPLGLIYGTDPNFGNRAYHVLEHTKEVANKIKHTIFNVTGEELFSLIDYAWLEKGLPMANDPSAYIIELDRVIGTSGEKTIKIVVYPGTSKIITAYPI